MFICTVSKCWAILLGFIEVALNSYQYNKDQKVSLLIWRFPYKISLKGLLKAGTLLSKGQFAVFWCCTKFISMSVCLQLHSLMWLFVNNSISNNNKKHQNCVLTSHVSLGVCKGLLQGSRWSYFRRRSRQWCLWFHTFSSVTSSAVHQCSSTELGINFEVCWYIIALHSQLRTFKLFALCFDNTFIFTWRRII